MPFLKFSRDKRGYENTYVVHAGRTRRGRPRTRVLYWFRTPPGVRVGRAALDEDAIRLMERHNPELTFDWTRILKGGPDPEPAPERHQRPRQKGEREPGAAPSHGPPAPEPALDAPPDAASADEPLAETALAAPPAAAEPEELGPVTPALARFGSEGLSRLRARHAEVLARISENLTDSPEREELKARADRLNPDTWVTEDEVTQGVEQYEAVYESLRAVIGRRRQRRRRPRVAGGPSPGPETPDPDASERPAGEGDAGE